MSRYQKEKKKQIEKTAKEMNHEFKIKTIVLLFKFSTRTNSKSETRLFNETFNYHEKKLF